ncbi:hypothetical protein GD1_172 [Paraglaciecola Antarctic GD virus 1]|nr:hypothetical protein GD1_172 [Paraglaciecola Antarctic GD virus 1]
MTHKKTLEWMSIGLSLAGAVGIGDIGDKFDADKKRRETPINYIKTGSPITKVAVAVPKKKHNKKRRGY